MPRWPMHAKLWLLFCATCGAGLILINAAELGATFDEPFYVMSGAHYWHTGSLAPLMRAGTMPLPVQWQTIPLRLRELTSEEMLHPISDLHRMLFLCRAMNLLFYFLVLVFTAKLARCWFGVWPATFVTTLVAFDPTLLAHSALATTDVALAASVLAAVFVYTSKLHKPWPERVLVPGVVFGLALLCKASALAYVPLLWWIVAWPTTRHEAKEFIQRLGIGFLVMLLWCGSDWQSEPSFQRWADTLPNSSSRNGMLWLAEHLRIFPNGAEGLIQQIKHNMRGHSTALLGEWHPRAVWYYFPVVLSAKLPELPLLLGAIVVLQPRHWQQPVARIVVALLLFSLNCRVQLGIRLQLPLVLFWYQLLPLLLPVHFTSQSRRAFVPWLVACALLFNQWQACCSPNQNHLGYINHYWGGVEANRQKQWFVDSNSDWGQGLPELRRWHQQHGRGDRLCVWYYGTDPAILLPPFEIMMWHQQANPAVRRYLADVGERELAVSQTMLVACPDRRVQTQAFLTWLRCQTPKARVGEFLIFNFSDMPCAATLPTPGS